MFKWFTKKEKKEEEQMPKKNSDKDRFVAIIEDAPPKELVHPEADGFAERVTPKQAPDNVYFFKCANCGKQHFRHAGYMQTMLPFMRSGGEKRVGLESYQVMVCVSCKNAYIWINEQMYDVTEHVDMNAWEKTEKEAHKATGPGGQC